MATDELKVLIIEANEADFIILQGMLSQQIPAARCLRVSSKDELEAAMKADDWAIVLFNYLVPGTDFLEFKDLIHDIRPDLPLILVSGTIGEEQAVELIKQGAWDFARKNNIARLTSAIKRGLQEAEDRRARKKAEGALRASEAKYRILFESFPQRVFTKDVDSVYLTCNQEFARALGVSTNEIVGHTAYDFLPKELADKHRASELKIMESGLEQKSEERDVLSPHEAWMQVTKTPIRDADGKISGILGIMGDITERKQNEQKLKEQAALLDIAPDAIFVRDMKHTIDYWNKGAEKIFGWSSVEALGKNVDDLLGTLGPDATNAYQIVLDKGEWVGEVGRTSKGGGKLTIQARWTLVRDSQGAPRGILAVDTDITQQRLVQRQLLRAQRLESIGALAGGIAHDLNNILSPILMGVDALSLQNTDVGSRKILDIIKTATQRGANVVRQVLSFAQGIESERAEVQLKHIIREIDELIRATFPKSIEIRTLMPRDLLTVTGDATQLHQVLMNLCVNARDAMPEGGTLTLTAENVTLDAAYELVHPEARPIRYVTLKVEDTGTGMSPETIDKIFDPFFTTKAPGKGTGLGLPTTFSIVKNHGGFINVYSEVGRGSAFTVYIPTSIQGGTERGERAKESLIMGQGELILVADDEAAVRAVIKQILESFGYNVLLAIDGIDAVALYTERRKEISVVLTDMMMPRMDGTATIRALREIDPDVKIICASGLMANEKSSGEAGLGADAFLKKPYTVDLLLKTLHDVIGAARRSTLT